MTDRSTAFAQRSEQKLVFDHKDMDYYLSWIVGRQAVEGSEPGECFETARGIVNADIASWQQAWRQLAQKVEAEAEAALQQGDREAARKAYLRASTYYRAPLFIMDPKEAAFREDWRKLHACFQKAAPLFDPPIESVQVPYQGKLLDGYFWKVDNSAQKRPTLIVIGGIETFAEDCYFMIGPAGPQHGYNVITADLPGQGVNPDQGLFMEPKSDLPIKAVVDYALTRSEIDPERLALYGFSWGGHIVLKGAQYEPRLKALIANPATSNIFRSALAQQGGNDKSDPIGRMVFEQLAWRWGVQLGNFFGRLGKAWGFLLHARADPRQIQCPTLCMAGESEAAITLKMTRACYEQLPHPQKKLVILTQAQGGAAHCQVDNLPLLHQIVFGWLHETLRP
ncbi:2,6-dihydropseudooxynicotine hydrolase [Thermoflexales bacterium]|nr:2,6-dihydropseudooxynicotine hydrolase [Thermoflexales bacterium]